MIENCFVTTESSFIELAAWDKCVDERLGHVVNNAGMPIWIGIDASFKHDSTAIVATTWDKRRSKYAWSRTVFFSRVLTTHSTSRPTIEQTVLDLKKRFLVRKVLYDPCMMQATAQRLTRAGLRMEEFPQSPANLTAASQNLFELIQGQNLLAYPDAAIRLAISRAVAIDPLRGWRITKDKQWHKIDVVVALAMAALAAVQGQGESGYDTTYAAFQPDFVDRDVPRS